MIPAGRCRPAIGIVIFLFVLMLGGCAAPRRPQTIERTDAPPAFATVAARYNDRVSRLDLIWARAVVELRYVDDKGRRRREQGEGHLQIRQPYEVALSVGKLGETYAWLGGDRERYWFFDKFEEPRVAVGRHENAGRPCSDSLGLPATPREMIDLMGVTPIPSSGGQTAWSEDGRWLLAWFPRGGAVERMTLHPETLLPARIEFAANGEAPDLIATLGNHEGVRQGDEGGYFPRMASRIDILHVSSDTRVTLHLSAMEDGASGRGKLSDAAFDFNTLSRVFAPTQIHVLDMNCPVPAIAQ